MVTTRRVRDGEVGDSNDDKTLCHPRILPFNQEKERFRQEKRGKKQKVAHRLLFNVNKVNMEYVFTNHLKLSQMPWPGSWREKLQTINAKIAKDNEDQVSYFRFSYIDNI